MSCSYEKLKTGMQYRRKQNAFRLFRLKQQDFYCVCLIVMVASSAFPKSELQQVRY